MEDRSRVLHVYYDLRVSPVTFDIVKFLLLSEIEKCRIGAKQIHLNIVLPDHADLAQMTERYAKLSSKEVPLEFFTARIENILIPCSKLIESITKVSVIERANLCVNMELKNVFPPTDYVLNNKPYYGIECLMSALRVGKCLPSITVPCHIKKNLLQRFQFKNPTLTITLRRTLYETWRNSNLAAWISFAKERIRDGYDIIWIDDPEGEYLDKQTLPGQVLQENTILLFAAIYEQSDCNFFVNGGTAALARFNHFATSVSFKLFDERSGATNRRFWLEKGIIPGTQFEFLSPRHLQCWESDSSENINFIWDSWAKSRIKENNSEILEQVHKWEEQITSRSMSRQIEWCERIRLDKPIYVWGLSKTAAHLKNSLNERGATVAGFIDSFRFDSMFEDLPVFHPNRLNAEQDKDIIIVPISKSGEDRTESLTSFINASLNGRANIVHYRHCPLDRCLG
ncbi:MAG: hypothetical protein ACFHVJ_20565 [Aestuariibacter sp.]